ncbi:MAG: hypothetical protein HY586_06675 [Candidatus Omnitrophica bacterium]|nr:hypothetical protein [Candidatus Omnitrophota bacterium]
MNSKGMLPNSFSNKVLCLQNYEKPISFKIKKSLVKGAMMESLFTFDSVMVLITLTALEIVLGIDNIAENRRHY